MDRLRRRRADAEGGGEEVSSRAEMLDSAQKLNAVALRLQGVIRARYALDLYLFRLELKGLLCPGREHKYSRDYKGGADVLTGDLIVVFKRLPLENHLKRLEGAAVVQLDEAEALLIAEIASPAHYGDFLIGKLRRILVKLDYFGPFHYSIILFG